MSKTVTITREQFLEAWNKIVTTHFKDSGQECLSFSELCAVLGFQEPNPPEERWLWVLRRSNGEISTSLNWLTEAGAKEWCTRYHYDLIGKDPNCLKPLIVSK